MRQISTHNSGTIGRALVFGVILIILLMLASAVPASADPGHGRRVVKGHVHKVKHHRKRHVVRHRDVYRHDRHYVVRQERTRFVVPRRIEIRHAPTYRTYRWGRVYHPMHRHYHAVYRFPVQTPYGVVYEAHAYCGDRAYAAGSFTASGPRFHVHFGF